MVLAGREFAAAVVTPAGAAPAAAVVALAAVVAALAAVVLAAAVVAAVVAAGPVVAVLSPQAARKLADRVVPAITRADFLRNLRRPIPAVVPLRFELSLLMVSPPCTFDKMK